MSSQEQEHPDPINTAMASQIAATAQQVRFMAELVHSAIQTFQELSRRNERQEVRARQDLGAVFKKIMEMVRDRASTALSHFRNYRKLLQEQRPKETAPNSSDPQEKASDAKTPEAADKQAPRPSSDEAPAVEEKMLGALATGLSRAELPQIMTAWTMAALLEQSPLVDKILIAVEEQMAQKAPKLMEAYQQSCEEQSSRLEAMASALERTAVTPLRSQEAYAHLIATSYAQTSNRRPSEQALKTYVNTRAKDLDLKLDPDIVKEVTAKDYTPSPQIQQLADEIKEVHPQVAASPKKTAAQAAQPASRPGTRVKRKPDASASARATRPRDPSRTASATRGK